MTTLQAFDIARAQFINTQIAQLTGRIRWTGTPEQVQALQADLVSHGGAVIGGVNPSPQVGGPWPTRSEAPAYCGMWQGVVLYAHPNAGGFALDDQDVTATVNLLSATARQLAEALAEVRTFLAGRQGARDLAAQLEEAEEEATHVRRARDASWTRANEYARRIAELQDHLSDQVQRMGKIELERDMRVAELYRVSFELPGGIERKAREQIAKHTGAEPPQEVVDLAMAAQHLRAAIGRLNTHSWIYGGVVEETRRKLEFYAANLGNVVEGELKRRETA